MAYPCISCYELVEYVKLRRYIRSVCEQLDDLPNDALIEPFFKIQRCQCCNRHMSRRPCTPFDDSLRPPALTYSVEVHCDCPCRYLLRHIVEKLRL